VSRTYRAGDSIEDYCRACKLDRMHTVIASGQDGLPIRVACGYCGSEHNFRGGPRIAPSTRSGQAPFARSGQAIAAPRAVHPEREPFPLVSERERTMGSMSSQDADIEMLLRRVIREEAGVTTVVPAEKWRGGSLVLKPGNATQEKSFPIETFFHKIVMIRNRLRTLEQQVNAAELPNDVKVKLQSYISGCYGSLTTFNVLFAEEDDQFKGSGE
jgi:hypothetical protein